MKKYSFKKKNILVVIMLAFMLCFSFGANRMHAFAENIDEVLLQDPEEKVLCQATLDDDFADDRVIITMNRQNSFRSFSRKDFSGVDCLEVRDLNEETGELVRKRLETVKTRRGLEKSGDDNMVEDIENYRKTLQIDLGVKSKENVLAANLAKHKEERKK